MSFCVVNIRHVAVHKVGSNKKYLSILFLWRWILSWHGEKQVLGRVRFVTRWWLGHSWRSIISGCAFSSLHSSTKQKESSSWSNSVARLYLIGNGWYTFVTILIDTRTQNVVIIFVYITAFGVSLFILFVCKLLLLVFLNFFCLCLLVKVLSCYICKQSMIVVNHSNRSFSALTLSPFWTPWSRIQFEYFFTKGTAILIW